MRISFKDERTAGTEVAGAEQTSFGLLLCGKKQDAGSGKGTGQDEDR